MAEEFNMDAMYDELQETLVEGNAYAEYYWFIVEEQVGTRDKVLVAEHLNDTGKVIDSKTFKLV